MAITICNTRAEVNAVVGVKQIWHDVPQGRWVVRTGADIETPSSDSFSLSRVQFLNGALIVGGQILLDAVNGYIADRLANGTPAQKIYWGSTNEFLRAHQYINQLRVAIRDAKTNAASLVEMDSIFLNGSTYSPALS